MDVLTPEQRRKNMQAIRSKNTRLEILLGRALWKAGMRYRKNDSKVFGTPDFVFKSRKIAVFCDSEFFHGKDWALTKTKIKSNIDFWHTKIESNIARDHKVNQKLKEQGWIVFRFWGQEIQKGIGDCIKKIESAYKQRTTIK